MPETKKQITLQWKLESKNFDEMKAEMIANGDDYTKRYVKHNIGTNHCAMCVLASGPMCIHRAVCRASKNEIWVNSGIEEIKK